MDEVFRSKYEMQMVTIVVKDFTCISVIHLKMGTDEKWDGQLRQQHLQRGSFYEKAIPKVKITSLRNSHMAAILLFFKASS